MKKIILLLLFLALFDSVCFSRITHNDCDHEWQLVKIENGERYWECSKCGDTYSAKKHLKNNGSLTVVVLLSIAAILLCLCTYLICSSCWGKSYNTERHFVNTVAFCVPFTITFIACVIPLYKALWYIGIPIAIIPSGIIGIIGSIIGHTINIHRAEYYELEKDDEQVEDERLKRKISIASGVVAAVSIGNNAKNAIKDIENVDGWKEMK